MHRIFCSDCATYLAILVNASKTYFDMHEVIASKRSQEAHTRLSSLNSGQAKGFATRSTNL